MTIDNRIELLNKVRTGLNMMLDDLSELGYQPHTSFGTISTKLKEAKFWLNDTYVELQKERLNVESAPVEDSGEVLELGGTPNDSEKTINNHFVDMVNATAKEEGTQLELPHGTIDVIGDREEEKEDKFDVQKFEADLNKYLKELLNFKM